MPKLICNEFIPFMSYNTSCVILRVSDRLTCTPAREFLPFEYRRPPPLKNGFVARGHPGLHSSPDPIIFHTRVTTSCNVLWLKVIFLYKGHYAIITLLNPVRSRMSFYLYICIVRWTRYAYRVNNFYLSWISLS